MVEVLSQEIWEATAPVVHRGPRTIRQESKYSLLLVRYNWPWLKAERPRFV